MTDLNPVSSICETFGEDLKPMIGGELPEEELTAQSYSLDDEEYLDAEDLADLSEDVGDED